MSRRRPNAGARRRVAAGTLALAGTGLVGGCALIAGTDGYTVDPSLDDATTDARAGADVLGDSADARVDASSDATSGDVSAADVTTTDAPVDVGADARASDASTDGGGAVDAPSGGGVYSSLGDPGVWANADVSSLAPGVVDGYNGGAFDGRYFYFAPLGNVVLRLDATLPASFASLGAWTAQAITATGDDGGAGAPTGFSGAVYDGRYVYFVPYEPPLTAGALSSEVVRYDTEGAFTAASSWQAFDTRAHFGAKAAGFEGAVFDGRYVYLVPNGGGTSGTVTRYDTQAASFQDASSWATFDMTSLGGAPSGMAGALYVSPYVLFVPSASGVIARYDTQAAFNAPAAWSTYDLSKVATSVPYGFVGGAVVGESVLLAPNFNDPSATYDGTVFTYDTSATLASAASWSTFDATSLAGMPQGFFGAAFDGRWVYFAPQLSSASGSPAFSGVMARYDTTAAFTTAASWQSADLRTVGAGCAACSGFGGAVFDGTYVYFIPATSSATFARFQARTRAATPPFASSFY